LEAASSCLTSQNPLHCLENSQPLHELPHTPRASSECSGWTEMEDRNEELQAFLFQERLEIEAHFGCSEQRRDAVAESGHVTLPLSRQYSNDKAVHSGGVKNAQPALFMPMVMFPSSPQSYQQDDSSSTRACTDCFFMNTESSPSSTLPWTTQPSVPVTPINDIRMMAFAGEEPHEYQNGDVTTANAKTTGQQNHIEQGKTGGTSRRHRRRQKKSILTLTQYIAVRCDTCTRPECRIECKRTGMFYQKCHCHVSQCVNDMVEVHYMNGECEDEWLSVNDPRIFHSQDEHWCEHGKLCNHMVRRGKCPRQSSECDACSGEASKCAACRSHASSFCHLDGCLGLKIRHASTRY